MLNIGLKLSYTISKPFIKLIKPLINKFYQSYIDKKC